MSLDFSLRAVAEAISDPESKAAAASLSFAVATVTAVTPGAALDGNAQVTVKINGSPQFAPYAAAWTPVNGHVVAVLLVAGSPIILGRIIGQPTI